MASQDSWLKFQLICKPEQSGKTFIMIQQIIRDIGSPIKDKEMLNIILCDNSLLLTKQTSQRVESELLKFIDTGTTYVEFSSHDRAECKDTSSVFKVVVDEGIRNVICCTNGKRIDDIYELITSLNTGKFTRNKFHVTIWLDEADKFIGFIDSTFIDLTKKFDLVHVKLITATPDDLFKHYDYLNVLPIEKTTSEQYHGWEDNVIKIYPSTECLAFSRMILTEAAKENVRPGTKWFIPAMSVKTSHQKMKDLCLSVNMAVLCVNGNGLVLTIPGQSDIRIEKDSEINESILKLYKQYSLESFAFAITGNICIGRGISIMSQSFMIDYAILSHYASKSEASQLAGRMKGNIKHFKGYQEKRITVYTTDEFHKVAVDWEKKSRNLAELAFQKDPDRNGTIIDKNTFNTCDKDYDYVMHPELFITLAKARNFLLTQQREMRMTKKRMKEVEVETEDLTLTSEQGSHTCCAVCKKNKPMHLCNGYFVTSKLLKQGQRVKDLSASDRLTIEAATAIPLGRCISSTNKGSPYLILPVYDSETTPGKNVKYQVRYIRFKNMKNAEEDE